MPVLSKNLLPPGPVQLHHLYSLYHLVGGRDPLSHFIRLWEHEPTHIHHSSDKQVVEFEPLQDIMLFPHGTFNTRKLYLCGGRRKTWEASWTRGPSKCKPDDGSLVATSGKGEHSMRKAQTSGLREKTVRGLAELELCLCLEEWS